ncbi:hypothetical protein [Sinorhizobium medicae]
MTRYVLDQRAEWLMLGAFGFCRAAGARQAFAVFVVISRPSTSPGFTEPPSIAADPIVNEHEGSRLF